MRLAALFSLLLLLGCREGLPTDLDADQVVRVQYDVTATETFGARNAARIRYTDADGRAVDIENVPLPWDLSILAPAETARTYMLEATTLSQANRAGFTVRIRGFLGFTAERSVEGQQGGGTAERTVRTIYRWQP